jgi:hypothetical protein
MNQNCTGNIARPSEEINVNSCGALTLRRPSCELMLRILLVAGDCRNSGRSASVSILAPWKLVLRTVSACSTELVSISLKDTAALFTCTETNRAKDRHRKVQ